MDATLAKQAAAAIKQHATDLKDGQPVYYTTDKRTEGTKSSVLLAKKGQEVTASAKVNGLSASVTINGDQVVPSQPKTPESTTPPSQNAKKPADETAKSSNTNPGDSTPTAPQTGGGGAAKPTDDNPPTDKATADKPAGGDPTDFVLKAIISQVTAESVKKAKADGKTAAAETPAETTPKTPDTASTTPAAPSTTPPTGVANPTEETTSTTPEATSVSDPQDVDEDTSDPDETLGETT